MRDLVFLRKNTKALYQQLQPTGRAWQSPDDSDSTREESVKSEMAADYLYSVEDFVSNIIPDNQLFTETDAENWERRLVLDYDPSTLTLEERQAEILRKLSYPGGFKNTLTLEFIEFQLRASLFDVRVYRNASLTQPLGTELIANSVDKEDGFVIDNYHRTFIIAGSDINTEAIIKTERRQEFIRKVLRYKPMEMICFLNSNISKQDGTFKLYYDTYVCELIEDTSPTASDLEINGTLYVAQTLTASYTYNDAEGDVEQGTVLQWFRVEGSLRSPISGANALTYILQPEDAGKTIRFSVTPANSNTSGNEIFSDETGIINTNVIPVIRSFSDFNYNTLLWSMSDGTQNTGTWSVEYSENIGGPWTSAVGTGSPRKPVLSSGTYDKTMYFRVKRTSIPDTEYSAIYSSYVSEIVNLLQIYSASCNVVDGSNSSPTDICSSGGPLTTGDIYLDGSTAPDAGQKLYFKDNNGAYHEATKDNLDTYPTSGVLDTEYGIKWIKFNNYSNDIYDVSPTTGIITGISSTYTCS